MPYTMHDVRKFIADRIEKRRAEKLPDISEQDVVKELSNIYAKDIEVCGKTIQENNAKIEHLNRQSTKQLEMAEDTRERQRALEEYAQLQFAKPRP